MPTRRRNNPAQAADNPAGAVAIVQGPDGNAGELQQIAQPAIVLPIGGGTTFTTAPLLGISLKISMPTKSTVAKSLSETGGSAGTEGR